MDTVEMIETTLNGKWTLKLPAHRAKRAEWITGWERERLDSMSLNIGPGDIVIDCGAEEMDLTALYASWIGKGDGGVIPVEPNPRVFSNGRAIWEANDLKPPIAFVAGFVGSENRHLDNLHLDIWPEEAYGPIVSDHGFSQLNERPDLPAVTIDTLVEMIGRAPTVITIDVEGSELHVLQGARLTLATEKPIVFVSVHPTFMEEQYGQDAQELYDYMGSLGYRSKFLAKDHELHFAYWSPHGRELRF